jgi:hypothetical protein
MNDSQAAYGDRWRTAQERADDLLARLSASSPASSG